MAAGAIKPLDGPRVPARRGPATALVVLLHGYGANGDDLIGLASGWQTRLPQAAFVAPNAPEEIPGMYGALQWFALTLRDPSEYGRGVVAAAPGIDRFIDQELRRLSLPPERLVLVGFSQGSMLALHVGLRRQRPPAALVAYSGLFAGQKQLGTTRAAPQILLVHGEVDDLIPVEALHAAREQLAGMGLKVEWHVRPGLGHGIDAGGQRLAAHFIAEALKG